MQRFSPKASSVLEKKIFKGFYHIWAWRPSWSMDCDHFSNFSFPQPKEAPYEIWAKLAQGLQRRSRLKMLTDGRTDGRTDARTDDGRKVITIAHPEHSSGELKTVFLTQIQISRGIYRLFAPSFLTENMYIEGYSRDQSFGLQLPTCSW